MERPGTFVEALMSRICENQEAFFTRYLVGVREARDGKHAKGSGPRIPAPWLVQGC